MNMLTIHLLPDNLGKELSGTVRVKNLVEFLQGIPEEKIRNAALYVDHSGVMLRSESNKLDFFNDSIMVGDVGFTPHTTVSSVLEIFMDSESIEVKSESHHGGNTTIATLMIVLDL